MRGKRSAMTLAVVIAIGLLVAAASAGAAITPQREAPTVAAAIGAPAEGAGSVFDLIPSQNDTPPPTIDPVATSTSPLPPYPRQGAGSDYAILSTGDAKLV